ncbi:MAG: hypothetical protein NZ578_05570 [Candidatus Binatia bacterium]|nr:hypothetical protein [Candidatus Binatia bacterium]
MAWLQKTSCHWWTLSGALGGLLVWCCLSCSPRQSLRPTLGFALPLHNNDQIELVAESQRKSWRFITFFRAFWDRVIDEWQQICRRDRCLQVTWQIVVQEDVKVAYLYLQPGRRERGRLLIDKYPLEPSPGRIHFASRIAARRVVGALSTLAAQP